MKKIISVILIICIGISIFPVFSLGKEQADPTEQIGIVNGAKYYLDNAGDWEGTFIRFKEGTAFVLYVNTATYYGYEIYSGEFKINNKKVTIKIKESLRYLNQNDTNIGKVMVLSVNDDKLTIVESNLSFVQFKVGKTFSKRPALDYVAERKIVEYGWYPQELVSNDNTIAALNKIGARYEWYSYEYKYAAYENEKTRVITNIDVDYKDVSYNGAKYRAVKIDALRPYAYYITELTTENSYVDDNGYGTGIYWFKYQPIKWIVADEERGILVSEQIIDVQEYNKNLYGTAIIGANGERYGTFFCDNKETKTADNYGYSSIRTWLNSSFTSTAFSSEEINHLKSCEAKNKYDNSYGSSPVFYDSTYDKVFLLSAEERVEFLFDDSVASDAYIYDSVSGASDYAKAQGLGCQSEEGYFPWWLRETTGDPIKGAAYNGYAYMIDEYGVPTTGQQASAWIGVRPAICLEKAILNNLIIYEKLQPISFTFSDDEGNYIGECYYSDSYFTKDSLDNQGATDSYNPQLSTMSCALAMSAYANPVGFDKEKGSFEAVPEFLKDTQLKDVGKEFTEHDLEKVQWKNVYDLFLNMGFDCKNFYRNADFDKTPGANTIGVAISSKKLSSGETLIAVAIRGGNYKNEWAGNFTVGENGPHEGFALARDETLRAINEYIKKYNISGKTKLWIVGYSRAGATANLTGAAIDDIIHKKTGRYKNIEELNLDYNDLYVYCIEPPAGGLKEEINKNKSRYNNIFCIVNPADLVPYVAPSQLGFGRYGITKYIPTSVSSSKYSDGVKYAQRFYHDLCLIIKKQKEKEVYHIDNEFKSYYHSDLYYEALKKEDGDIATYLNRISDKIIKREITEKEIEQLFNYEKDFPQTFSQAVFLADSMRLLCNEVFHDRNYYSINLQEKICKLILASNISSILNGVVFTSVGVMAIELFPYLLALILDGAFIEDDIATITGKESFVEEAYNLIYTFCENNVFKTHEADVTFSWLASMDKNYDSNATINLNNGLHRVLQVNCNVNIDVYDSSDLLVAQIIGEKPQEISYSSILAVIDEDGQKVVYLPADETYTVVITGNEDNDSVNCSIKEYSAEENDYTRIVTFTDMAIDKDEKIVFDAPAYEDDSMSPDPETVWIAITDHGKTTEYGAVPILPTVDLSGEEALNAYYQVTATPDDENAGFTTGSGLRQYGDFAQVEAFCNEEYEFDGWYVGEQRVSKESVYRFMVKSDVEIIGKFKKGATLIDNLNPGDVDGDGKLTSADARLALRASVKLENYKKGSSQFKAADVDKDGSISSADARLILRASVKLEDPTKW